jgi:AraC-like DNA-binding protein
MREMGIPTVFISKIPFAEGVAVAYVQMDQFAAGRMATEHFASRGFKELGYIGQYPMGNSKELFEGFQERATELDCRLHLHNLKDYPAKSVDEVVSKRRRNTQKTIDWLLDLPRPLGLLGYHDKMAGNLLRNLITGKCGPDTCVKIPPKGVVERHSTNVLAISEPRVASAIRFIWDHMDQPVTTEDVAKKIKVPYGTLTRLFTNHLGRSVNAELRRKRLEVCCSLLRDTSMTVEAVAKAVGFSSKSYLHKIFQKKFSMSPRDYRLGKHTPAV